MGGKLKNCNVMNMNSCSICCPRDFSFSEQSYLQKLLHDYFYMNIIISTIIPDWYDKFELLNMFYPYYLSPI